MVINWLYDGCRGVVNWLYDDCRGVVIGCMMVVEGLSIDFMVAA